MTGKRKTALSWSSVKTGLRGFDRTALLGLIQDLYAANKDNQAFLHARLNLGGDPLKPYKAVISRWVCPDIFKNQPVSVAKAKKAIADYKKAIGYPEGMAELSVFYCEEAIVFLRDCSMDDEGYYTALVLMFEQALKRTLSLPEGERAHFLERLGRVRAAAQKIGWGFGDGMAALWYAFANESGAEG
ncbi:MAG: hypothetical protein WBX25_11550 [Rhodomicrobium sp.]